MMSLELPGTFRAHFKNGDVFDSIMNLRGEVFREQKNRKTLFIRKQGKGYFVKIHRGVGLQELFKNILSLKWPVLGAHNEARAIRFLEKIGVDTMKMVGFGVRGVSPAWLESFVITEELVDIVSLEDYCRRWKEEPPDFNLKLTLIKKVADITRKLHQNGVNHRDYYICHFLLDVKSLKKQRGYAGLILYLIDLHRVQIRTRTPERWAIKDLAGLFFSSMDIGLTRRDIFRFMKIYSGKSLKTILRSEQDFWGKVHERAAKLYRKHFHRAPHLMVK
jgi:heptose I phosphotransferase